MTDRIDLTWPDGDGHPMRIMDTNPVSYEVKNEVIEDGKKVIKTTQIQYTARCPDAALPGLELTKL